MHKILIIAGPTAGGKSAFAADIAQKRPAVIINADSQQLYRDTPIITAQPEQNVDHVLYGILAADERCNAAMWSKLAAREIQSAWEQGKLPILVGGTGLYLKALVEGLSAIPTVPQEIREHLRVLQQEKGTEAMHALLAEKDPEMAARLKPGDTQRILRALEVLETTGQSLAIWQQKPTNPFFPREFFKTTIINPPREELYARCDRRFMEMLNHGALEEAKKLQQLPRDLPVMRALGLIPLLNYLEGKHTLEAAITIAQQQTRNYAKRQVTWFKNQPLPQQRNSMIHRVT